MVGVMAHGCSPACSIWCSDSTLRTGGDEHFSIGCSSSRSHMPLLNSGGGLATGTDISCPERLHLPAGVRCCRACNGADTWPRNIPLLVGAIHYLQASGSHQIQLCRTGMPPTSLILPEHHHVVLTPSLHNRVPITATALTRASLLVLGPHAVPWAMGVSTVPRGSHADQPGESSVLPPQ